MKYLRISKHTKTSQFDTSKTGNPFSYGVTWTQQGRLSLDQRPPEGHVAAEVMTSSDNREVPPASSPGTSPVREAMAAPEIG